MMNPLFVDEIRNFIFRHLTDIDFHSCRLVCNNWKITIPLRRKLSKFEQILASSLKLHRPVTILPFQNIVLHDYYDGPRSGICQYDNRKYYYNLIEDCITKFDSEDIDPLFTKIIRYITPGNLISDDDVEDYFPWNIKEKYIVSNREVLVLPHNDKLVIHLDRDWLYGLWEINPKTPVDTVELQKFPPTLYTNSVKR